jgi:hypothetical protein
MFDRFDCTIFAKRKHREMEENLPWSIEEPTAGEVEGRRLPLSIRGGFL